MFLYEEYIEKQSSSLLLNKTAITIRPGSLKSIFSTQEAIILVTKDAPLPRLAENLTNYVLIYNMLHEHIACSALHWAFTRTGVILPLPSVLTEEDVSGKNKG